MLIHKVTIAVCAPMKSYDPNVLVYPAGQPLTPGPRMVAVLVAHGSVPWLPPSARVGSVGTRRYHPGTGPSPAAA